MDRLRREVRELSLRTIEKKNKGEKRGATSTEPYLDPGIVVGEQFVQMEVPVTAQFTEQSQARFCS